MTNRTDRSEGFYRMMMSDAGTRERVKKSRARTLAQRMAGVVASAMACGALTPTVALVLDWPLGYLLAIAFGAGALLSLHHFLFESTVLYRDLRQLDAELCGRAPANGEA